MDDWFAGSFLEMDEKDPTTGKKKYLLGPDFGKVWVTIICIFLLWFAAFANVLVEPFRVGWLETPVLAGNGKALDRTVVIRPCPCVEL